MIISYAERPEEAIDHRTLYERLKEQKDRKQEEFMEQLKFSKSISMMISVHLGYQPLHNILLEHKHITRPFLSCEGTGNPTD